MLYRGVLATDLSGTLNGMVAARNRGGSYLREHVIPVDPETPRQVNCREALEQLWQWWTTTMNQDDRDAWERYAHSQLRTGRIGQRRELVGWTAFCRQHYHRFQVIEQLAIAMDPGTAPPLYPAGLTAIPSLAFDSGTTANLLWGAGDTWENDQDNALVVYTSDGISPYRNFYKGPYKLRAAVLGDPDTPPTPPTPIDLGDAAPAGTRVWYRIWFISNDRERAGYFAGRMDIPA